MIDARRELRTSSQKLNPFYGYLWWLNCNANATKGARRLETAPSDMFSANGALNRRCFVVPSLQLVVTRLGDSDGLLSWRVCSRQHRGQQFPTVKSWRILEPPR